MGAFSLPALEYIAVSIVGLRFLRPFHHLLIWVTYSQLLLILYVTRRANGTSILGGFHPRWDPTTTAIQNDLAEILLGLFIAWQNLSSLFYETPPISVPTHDRLHDIWASVETTLPPHIRTFAENIELLHKSKVTARLMLYFVAVKILYITRIGYTLQFWSPYHRMIPGVDPAITWLYAPLTDPVRSPPKSITSSKRHCRK